MRNSDPETGTFLAQATLGADDLQDVSAEALGL